MKKITLEQVSSAGLAMNFAALFFVLSHFMVGDILLTIGGTVSTFGFIYMCCESKKLRVLTAIFFATVVLSIGAIFAFKSILAFVVTAVASVVLLGKLANKTVLKEKTTVTQ